jgi:hypothetical protein
MTASININYDTVRPKACAFFAGRAWYAGVPSGEKLGWVLFSQVLDDIANIDRCYQQNDPTSEVFSDLQDSDGGVIQIPDAGEIVALVPLSKSLFVFGSNGVWQIIGSDTGFSAASYSVEKVTNVGCLFQKTILQVEDSIFYWSTSGIYVLAVDKGGLTAEVKNISDVTIKTIYQSIPITNKTYADGAYNGSTKEVQWLYSDTELENTSSGRYRKNKILCYNAQLNSFYTYTLDNSVGPIVASIATTKETVETSTEYSVYVGADSVLSNTDEVVVDIPVISGSRKQFKYLSLFSAGATSHSITWSDMEGVRFADWYTYNTTGNEKQAYVITGYNMGNVGPARNKTASYIHMFLDRTETGLDADAQPINPGGCLMQTRWDFTDNSYPSKWSADVQVYRQLRPFWGEPNTTFDDGYPLVITKNKVRGRGKAIQIKLSSEAGKDMSIIGWSMGFVGNTNV